MKRVVERPLCLLPCERLYLEGPVVANLPVSLAGSRTTDLWVFAKGPPGVRVVEGPLDYVCPEPVRKGALVVAVDPGARCLISRDSYPWALGPLTLPESELAARARDEGVRQARSMASSVRGGEMVFDSVGPEKFCHYACRRSVRTLRNDG